MKTPELAVPFGGAGLSGVDCEGAEQPGVDPKRLHQREGVVDREDVRGGQDACAVTGAAACSAAACR